MIRMFEPFKRLFKRFFRKFLLRSPNRNQKTQFMQKASWQGLTTADIIAEIIGTQNEELKVNDEND